MNSLEQLNGFGQSSIVFEDPQATPTFGTFVDDGLPNKTGFATEDSFYTLGNHPFGGNFVGAEGLDNATNNWIQVEITCSGGTTQGSEYFFDVPTLKRNITYTINDDTLTYNYIQTNVDMQYMINNTRVYLKNAPSEVTATPPDTVITVSVKWDQSVVPQPNIKSQATILTVTQLPELDNVGNRTYLSGQFNSIFNSNPIEILDENFYSPEFDDVEYEEGMPIIPEEYALTLITSTGSWKTLTGTAPYPSSITLFGLKDDIRTQIQSTKYVPVIGSTATATVNYYLEVPARSFNSGTQTYPTNWHRTAEGTFNITGTQRTTTASWEGEFEDTSVTLIEEMILFSKADILVVGGGGGGGAISTRTQLTANEDGLTGGGGGSGYFVEMQGTDLLQQGTNGQQITMIKGTGGVGANWDTTTIPTDGTGSELLLNSVQMVVAPGGGRGGSSYNAPNQPYGLGTPTTAFVEFNGANGGMGGGAAGANLNMPGGGQTFGGTGGVGVVNTLTASGISQTFGLNGDNGNSTGSGWDAGGGGGTPTTGGSSTIPSGPTILSQIIDVGQQFCEHAPEGGTNISQYNPTQYVGSGGKGMGYDYFSTTPRTHWNAQDGFDGKVKIRIRQA